MSGGDILLSLGWSRERVCVSGISGDQFRADGAERVGGCCWT